MAWKVEFNAGGEKNLHRLAAQARNRILHYLNDRIEGCDDPRIHGKALSGRPAGRGRYRTGDYRIICRIEDDGQTVVVLSVGHRREVYR